MKWLTFFIIAGIIILSAGLIADIVAMQVIGAFMTIAISGLKIGVTLKEFEKTEREIMETKVVTRHSCAHAAE